jgi:hypothetical protein
MGCIEEGCMEDICRARYMARGYVGILTAFISSHWNEMQEEE